MSDSMPRLAPRSAGAAADVELLRVARTDLDESEPADVPSIADRIRALAAPGTARASRSALGVLAHRDGGS